MFSKKNLLIAGAVAAVLAFGALFVPIVMGPSLDVEEQLRFAMELLDKERWDIAGRIGRDLEERQLIDPETDSAWNYVTGVSKLQSIQEELDSASHRRVLLDATKYLERAGELGFPVGFQGKGHYYLGFCYFHTYQWPKVIETLAGAELLWPERRSEAFNMVFQSQANTKPPRVDEARTTIDSWAAIPGKSKEEQAKIDVAEGQLALLNNLTKKGERILKAVADKTAERGKADLLRCLWRIEQREKQKREELPESALPSDSMSVADIDEMLRKIIIAAESPPQLKRQAIYLSGRNLRAQGKLEEALGVFNGIRQRDPESAEAIAAAIEETEILLELNELEDVVSTTHHLLRNIEDLSLYNETWLSVVEMKTRILDVGRALRQAGEFETTLKFTEHIPLAFPLSYAVRMQAETYQQWADAKTALPAGNTEEERIAHRDEVRGKYKMAGEKYERLAGLELRSTEYPDILWEAITSYQAGNDLESANRLLKDYLRFEVRTRRPRGYLVLGRNLMNEGSWTEALSPLERCLNEYPNSPVSYEARLMAGKAFKELNQLDDAIDALQSNLWDFELHPNSEVWKDTLFELGETLFARGEQQILNVKLATDETWDETEGRLKTSYDDFINATARLGEAISRYPEDPRYYYAKYLTAKSYRLAAEMPDRIAKSSQTIMEPTRRLLVLQRRDLLEKALAEYREIYQEINANSELLSEADKHDAIVRNCYFGEADTLFDLQRWDDAIKAYRNAAGRFLNQPESLEALVQMAECHRKMGRDDDAKRTLEQAEMVLSRIPPELDSNFVKYTRADRKQWGQLLGWLQEWN